VKTGAEYFGLNASREEGIRKMEIAASQSPWAWTESLSVLSYIYQFIDIDKVRGLEVSKKLVKEFPNNYDYKIHYAVSLLQTGDFKSSKLILDDLDKTLYKQRPRHQKGFGSYLNYLWGHYYYIMGNEEKSLEYLDKCINYYFAELDAFLGEAYFLKAKIMDKRGNRAEARKLYRKCIKLDNFSNVITLSKEYLNDPFEG
ncbi:MAG: tetratricopeptide repeat protein, partial [Candidatus Marinimicrobia bacterium]|nr:tetratricopeptide repeat protein [Candidatus Neomarinimicrobiota bacterium]